MKVVKFIIITLLILFVVFASFYGSRQIDSIIVNLTNFYNSTFCFKKGVCIELPKNYMVLISGKNINGTIKSYQWFIEKNDALNDKLIPESIMVNLFQPDKKSESILMSYSSELNRNIELLKIKSIPIKSGYYNMHSYYEIRQKGIKTIYLTDLNISITSFDENFTTLSFLKLILKTGAKGKRSKGVQ